MVLAASFVSLGIMFAGIRFLFLFLKKFENKKQWDISPPKVKNETFLVSTSAWGKGRLSTQGWPPWVSKAIRGAAFFPKMYCDVSLWKVGAHHSKWEHTMPSITVTWFEEVLSYPEQWLCSTGTYPSASSIGSGGVSREADGMTVLVPRETRSCSVFVDREATAIGCSRVVVMPVVTVRLWPEPLRVRSGVGRSGLRMLTRQKAEPLLGMKFTLFLSGQ